MPSSPWPTAAAVSLFFQGKVRRKTSRRMDDRNWPADTADVCVCVRARARAGTSERRMNERAGRKWSVPGRWSVARSDELQVRCYRSRSVVTISGHQSAMTTSTRHHKTTEIARERERERDREREKTHSTRGRECLYPSTIETTLCNDNKTLLVHDLT